MKSSIQFKKVYLDGKWVYSADTENVPYIYILKTGEYKTKLANGKNKICKTFDEAKKAALDTWNKYKGFKLE